MPGNVLDVFGTDNFGLVSMTRAINIMPVQPRRLGQMGIFTPEPINTRTALIEMEKGRLVLINEKPRGGEADVLGGEQGMVVDVKVPHFPLNSTVHADDVEGVRELGTENQFMTVNKLVAKRLATLRRSHEATHELLRVGAIHGKVLNPAGGTILDIFNRFNIVERTHDFVLSNAATDMQGEVLSLKQKIEDAMQGEPFDHIHVLCGRLFFKAFIAHAKVREAYQYWKDGEMFRSDPRAGFPFCGVVFEEYHYQVGTKHYLDPNKARAFPVGADIYPAYQAPANYIDTVNTLGELIYAKTMVKPDETGVDILTQSNHLPVCVIPGALIGCTKS